MLAALAEAGRRFDRADWLDAAGALAEFLLGPLSDGGGCTALARRRGQGDGLPRGLRRTSRTASYELHVATGEPRWLLEAHRLATLAVELFGTASAAASS